MMWSIGSNTDGADLNNTDCTDNQCNQKLISVISDKAFTLIEVMISVVILSFGLVIVISGFINSLSVLNASQNRIKAAQFLNQKFSELQMESLKQGGVDKESSGEFKFRGRQFNWSLGIASIKEPVYLSEELTQASLMVNWSERKRAKDVLLVTYLPKKKK